MKCTKCDKDIKGKEAWINCKPYCSDCFDSARKSKKTNGKPLPKYYLKWLEMQKE